MVLEVNSEIAKSRTYSVTNIKEQHNKLITTLNDDQIECFVLVQNNIDIYYEVPSVLFY